MTDTRITRQRKAVENVEETEGDGNQTNVSDNTMKSEGGKEMDVVAKHTGTPDQEVTLETIQNSIVLLHEKLDAQQLTQEQCGENVQNNSSRLDTLETDYQKLREENRGLRAEMSLIKAIVSKQSAELDLLKRQSTDQQARSMRQNVLFHGIPEEKNENCTTKMTEMLRKLKYPNTFGFEVVHRLGIYNPQSDRPRPIIAKMGSFSQADLLLKFGSKVKDQLRITPQTPTELRERRKQLVEVAEAARQKDRSCTSKFIAGELYLNNERHVHPLPRPTVRDILLMSDAEKKEAAETKFITTSRVVDGSTFTVRCAEAHSLPDCRALYKSLLLHPDNMSATHNTAAYRLYKPDGASLQDGYTDDGEHAMGRAVRDAMHALNIRNAIVFVTRHYGGTHLGPKRFSVVKELIEEVAKKFKTPGTND